MSEVNVILAPMAGRTICTTKTVYQYNQGMILRFVGIDLPEAYVVDFANSVTGTSISQVGGENGVTIPDQFFTPGSTIHAWVVLSGTGYSVTRYHIMIPISPRASRTNDTPTPSQQSALDEAIAALNDAVDAAETAITHYPTVIDGYWHVWDVTAGEYVSTGVAAQGPQGIQGPPGADGSNGADGTDGTTFTPSVSSEGVISWTNNGNKQNPSPVNIKGPAGADGTNGTNGTDGVSPTVTVTDITGGHRVTITDAEHPNGQVIDVMDGSDGQTGPSGADGYSPTASVSKSGSTATITITDKNGTTTATVSDGQDGQQGPAGADGVGVPAGGTTGQVLSKASGTDYDTEWTTLNPVVTVYGSTPTITALPGIQYVCGEVSTLDITLPASGCVDVVFESGSTATVLTVTPQTGMTVEWANGFDSTALEADTLYELNIKMVGTKCLGVAGSWT